MAKVRTSMRSLRPKSRPQAMQPPKLNPQNSCSIRYSMLHLLFSNCTERFLCIIAYITHLSARCYLSELVVLALSQAVSRWTSFVVLITRTRFM